MTITAWSRADITPRCALRSSRSRTLVAGWLVTLKGKLRREALGEIMAGVSELRYYAGLARNIGGRVLEVEPQCYSQSRERSVPTRNLYDELGQ